MSVAPALALSILKDLVAIPSVNPGLVPGGQGEAAIADHIRERMAAWGWRTMLQDAEPGRPNVIAMLSGRGGGKSLMFNGHIDTVSVEGLSAPFEPVERDGKLFGRGAADMKGGIAAMMAAAECIGREGRPAGDVIMTFVADEEYLSAGTEAVVRAMKDGGLPRPDAAINTEPTGAKICAAHKGFAWIDVTTRGVAAHGSRPDLGIDAITAMAPVLRNVDALAVALANGPKDPVLGTGSVHASLISGGREISTYPDSCLLQIERRTVPGEDDATLERECARLVEGADGAEAKVTFVRAPWREDPNAAISSALREAARRGLGHEPEIMTMTGWLDIALLADAGIPSVVFGAGGGGFHAHEEWADIDTLDAVASTYVELVREWCG